jgi:hypothetical protein
VAALQQGATLTWLDRYLDQILAWHRRGMAEARRRAWEKQQANPDPEWRLALRRWSKRYPQTAFFTFFCGWMFAVGLLYLVGATVVERLA